MMGKGSVPSESSPKYLFLSGEAAFRFPLHNTHTQKNERPHDNSDQAFFVVLFLSTVCVCVSVRQLLYVLSLTCILSICVYVSVFCKGKLVLGLQRVRKV